MDRLLKGKGLEGWISRILPLDVAFDGLTQEDVDAALLAHRPVPLLFGRFSTATVLEDLRQAGLEERLARRGYSDLEVIVPELTVGQEGLQITASHPDSPERVLLMELKAYWGHLPMLEGTCRALVWDWLELRDPMARFEPSRPPLPGQTAPGLSMFHDLVKLMRAYVAQTEAEALVTIPQHFHNAVLYQKDTGLRYRFLDPLRQGQLMAQMRDLLGQGDLYTATWAFAEDRVEVLEPGAQDWVGYAWTPSELVLALNDKVRDVLDHQEQDPELARGLAFRFRIAKKPHPDIEGSFHLG
jgi:hypothetical protein